MSKDNAHQVSYSINTRNGNAGPISSYWHKKTCMLRALLQPSFARVGGFASLLGKPKYAMPAELGIPTLSWPIIR